MLRLYGIPVPEDATRVRGDIAQSAASLIANGLDRQIVVVGLFEDVRERRATWQRPSTSGCWS